MADVAISWYHSSICCAGTDIVPGDSHVGVSPLLGMTWSGVRYMKKRRVKTLPYRICLFMNSSMGILNTCEIRTNCSWVNTVGIFPCSIQRRSNSGISINFANALLDTVYLFRRTMIFWMQISFPISISIIPPL